MKFTFLNLYEAYLNCRKNKRNTLQAMQFEINYESKLLKLEKALNNRRYRPERSICFIVTNPKVREVFAASFKDRVVHHLLYNFLTPVFEPKFIDQSYACRENKGIHKSVKDMYRYLNKVTENKTKTAYFIHLDIKSFFMSINKNILYQIIQKHIKDTDILWLANKIIFHDPTTNYYYKGDKSLIKLLPNDKSLFYGQRHKGLPIGNLTSQFFANVYLNELDQFVKHELKAKFYLRYVDDFILLHENKQTLLYYKTQIDKFLKTNLDLELNQNKQVLQKTDKGIDWLGYYIKPYYTLSRKRVVKAFKKKLYEFNNEIDALLIDNSLSEKELPILLEKYLATINSYYGHFRHANCYRLRKTLYEAHFHTLKTYYAPKNKSYSSIIIKILFRK